MLNRGCLLVHSFQLFGCFGKLVELLTFRFESNSCSVDCEYSNLLKNIVFFRVQQNIIKLVVRVLVVLHRSCGHSGNASVDSIELVDQTFVSDLFQEWCHEIASSIKNDKVLNVTEVLI